MIWMNKDGTTAIDLDKVSAYTMGSGCHQEWTKNQMGIILHPYPLLKVFVSGGEVQVQEAEATELFEILKKRFYDDRVLRIR